ncbi:hypothetical protein DFR31_2420 [Alkalispirillum mobile]|uniref:Uncharacterized protein n=1 Tax=Alkalispirillum mobile TaxID=85925 RepID=A0A498BUJ3_9GAMM|nr:hypothetical protein [Alkalispirillum mobile]RLK47102.1 hypothetical protein DFR31_2420 [Alkalispirillum mobile]
MRAILTPCLLTLLILAPAGAALALQPLPGPDDTRVVPDEVLAEQRGGFFGRNGMEIAIGLEQATAINGEEVHRTVLRELAPLGRGGNVPADALRQVVINTGNDGTTVRQLSDQTIGWVTAIQNELDGQQIQHTTIMQLELNNVEMPRSDLARSLERQLIEGSISH